MDIHQMLENDEHEIASLLADLLALPPPSLETRCALVARLRPVLMQNGRAANPVYAHLLRSGCDPAAVLHAIESHTIAFQYLTEVENHVLSSRQWQESIALLGLLLEDYFDALHEIRSAARVTLSHDRARQLAQWHERKLAAERRPAAIWGTRAVAAS